MLHMTHLDGADVVVIDSHGRYVPDVDEVRIEPGYAVVAVSGGALGWLQDLLANADETLTCAIRSRDGQLHHCGAVRVACVCV
jgi:hypothetical protein